MCLEYWQKEKYSIWTFEMEHAVYIHGEQYFSEECNSV